MLAHEDMGASSLGDLTEVDEKDMQELIAKATVGYVPVAKMWRLWKQLRKDPQPVNELLFNMMQFTVDLLWSR